MILSQRSAGGGTPATVSATRFVFKLCGASQPAIIEGSDGACYAVRFNDRGPSSLMSEVVGGELIRILGLSSPDWVPIELSRKFLSANPTLSSTRGIFSAIPPGRHFGSRLIEAREGRTYQMIPHSWIDRIENRQDFLGMLILDLWANNCERRQAVFFSSPEGRLHASFTDNGMMFGGKFRNENTNPRRAMVYDLSFYKGLWRDNNDDVVQEWLRKFEGIGGDAILGILSSVPKEWVDRGSCRHIMSQLSERRQRILSLLNEAKRVLDSSDSTGYLKKYNATEPGQILTAPIFPFLPS